MSENKSKRLGTGPRLVTKAPPPPPRLTGGCTPPQTGKEASNPPEYSPSLSDVVEFNAARRECHSIIDRGRDPGVDQLTWEYEAKRWAHVVRPRLDQVITDRRKSGAPDEHLAKLATLAAMLDAEFKLVCARRVDIGQLGSVAAKKQPTGKVPVLTEWLREIFSGNPVPSPSHCPRKELIGKAIKELPALCRSLDEKTMNRAIKEYCAELSNGRK